MPVASYCRATFILSVTHTYSLSLQLKTTHICSIWFAAVFLQHWKKVPESRVHPRSFWVCVCARDGCVLQGSNGDYRLLTVAQTLNFSLLMRSSRVYEEPFFYSAIAWKCNCNKNVRALTLFLVIRHVCDTNT